MSHADERLIGMVMLATLVAWPLLAVLTGRVLRLHRDRFAAYRQSCADAFDSAWDDVAALFPQSVDELAARRVRGGGPTT